jgi:hypothetical protein
MSFIDDAIRIINDSFDKVADFFADFFSETGDAEAPDVLETLRIDFDPENPLPAVGVLKEMGYRVGKSGLLPRERREILWRTFRVHLVFGPDCPSDYIREWGGRCSPARLEKMHRVLGGLVANAKRKTKVDMSEAIRDWNEDQVWLRNIAAEWLTHTH